MKVKIGENIFKVKIADDNRSRAIGMMGKTFNDNFNGMLFLMNDYTNCFWMKNCTIPLDIIFIDNQIISKIHHNCLPCGDKEDCDSYCGRGYVILEITGGSSKDLGINKGDEIKFIFD
jgi:uncharacterized membrane protein (UPF0127 family)